MSNVRSVPLDSGEKRQKPPEIGFLSGAGIERAFVVGLYIALALLAALSVLGTFYGMQSMAAPLGTPLQVAQDVAAAPSLLGAAFGLQLALTLAQYGARQRARRNRRWVVLYLASLAWSGYYNVTAYYEPAVAMGIPWGAALLLIIIGDVVPEMVAVKEPRKE